MMTTTSDSADATASTRGHSGLRIQVIAAANTNAAPTSAHTTPTARNSVGSESVQAPARS